MRVVLCILLIAVSGCGKPVDAISDPPASTRLSAPEESSSPVPNVVQLARMLGDDDPKVRYNAAQALWKMGPECAPALPQLIEHIDDEEWVQFENPRRGGEVRMMVDRAIGQIEEGVVPLLIACLDSPKVARRRNAVKLLAARKDPRAIEPMIKLLHDPNRLVRAVAAEQLGYFRKPETALPLAAALKDEDWYVRMKAASALGSVNASGVVSELMLALQDSEENVRSAAAFSLGTIGDTQAVTALSNAATGDKSLFVRRAATESLSRIEKQRDEQNSDKE